MESVEPKVYQLVKIRTKDDKVIECSLELLAFSGYFTGYLEGRDIVDEELDMTALNITEDSMKSVLEFSELLTRYKAPIISKPIKHQSMFEVTSPIFASFSEKFDDEKLCEMIMVADKLDIGPLQDLLSAKLAIQLLGKSIEEIRTYFNILKPFDSPEEEKRVKEENEEAKEIYSLNEDED